MYKPRHLTALPDYMSNKVEQYCRHCNISLDKGKETLRKHAWDHLVIYTCQYGVYTEYQESVNGHQKHVHGGGPLYHYMKVDEPLYQKAVHEFGVQLPHRFPQGGCITKLPIKTRTSQGPLLPAQCHADTQHHLPSGKFQHLVTTPKTVSLPSSGCELAATIPVDLGRPL